MVKRVPGPVPPPGSVILSGHVASLLYAGLHVSYAGENNGKFKNNPKYDKLYQANVDQAIVRSYVRHRIGFKGVDHLRRAGTNLRLRTCR